MPIALRSNVLKTVYAAASRRIADRAIPTEPISSSRSLYRSFDVEHLNLTPDGALSRHSAKQSLIVRDIGLDRNRFSGQSFDSAIPARGGLYCSLQQQAQINEILHYARAEKSIPRDQSCGFPRVDVALHKKCIVKVRLTNWLLAADLSPHNSASQSFLEDILHDAAVQAAFLIRGEPPRSAWDALNDSADCSFARGIGLAVANSGYLGALQAETVRPSERSPGERGDNLVLFSGDSKPISNLVVEEAYLFPLRGAPEVIPVG